MNAQSSAPIAVLGAGSWGSALAISLARKGEITRLWGRDPQRMAQMQAQRVSLHYLAGVELPKNLTVSADLGATLTAVQDVLIAVPSHAVKSLLVSCKPLFANDVRIICATKGLEPQQHNFIHQIVANALGEQVPYAILSGPTFAKEIVAGYPTAASLASKSAEFCQHAITRLATKFFRIYSSTDVIGVELGGVVKNVLAIAAGIIDGLGFGANTRAALITRSLIEMMRLGEALGCQPQTLMGLSGLGDLVLTCTDNQSRNRRFGLAIGRGETLDTAVQAIGQVVEGQRNAAEVRALAQQHQIDMPIVEQVYQILYANKKPLDAVHTLLERALTTEF